MMVEINDGRLGDSCSLSAVEEQEIRDGCWQFSFNSIALQVSVRRAHILACLSCSVFLGRVLSGPTRLLCTLRCQARPFRYYLGGWVSIYSPAFESFHAVFRSKFQFLTPQNLRARFLSREEKKEIGTEYVGEIRSPLFKRPALCSRFIQSWPRWRKKPCFGVEPEPRALRCKNC
jgi:hypothetical protein